jgi:hypothetical protein
MLNLLRRKVFAPLVICLALLVTSCAAVAPPSQFSQTQQETTARNAPAAVAKAAEQGSSFNAFFPKTVAGYNDVQIVAAQEKKGFAEYKVNQGGQNVAVLSINDTLSNPTAAEKYKSSTRQIAGFPALDIGSNGTGLLVADRYQVKVQSRNESFAKDDRETWLTKFDLKGLANLK